MITVRILSDDLKRLGDPALIYTTELQMIDRAVDVIQPIARDESPVRTGRGRAMILGKIYEAEGHPRGRVFTGKAFWLRILQTGAVKHDIAPFRFKRKAGARRAARALGPARARGAMRALRFKLGGVFMFRNKIEHPGLKADPWMDRAAQKSTGPVGRAAELVVQSALDRATRG
jgi:hypothetical protein